MAHPPRLNVSSSLPPNFLMIHTPIRLSLLELMNPGFSSKIFHHLLPRHTPQTLQFRSAPHDPLENKKQRQRKKHKKAFVRRRSMSSMTRSLKPNNSMLLMATSLSAAPLSIWGRASHTTFEMTLTLKRDLPWRIKVWVPSRRYGGIHISTHTANIFCFVQSQ